jgi:hypothetical protein
MVQLQDEYLGYMTKIVSRQLYIWFRAVNGICTQNAYV